MPAERDLMFDVPLDETYEGPTCGKMPLDSGEMVHLVSEPGSFVAKIGTTTNLDQRLASLRSRHSRTLVLRWSFHGNTELEFYLHRCFKHLALGGEWFDFKEGDPVQRVAAATEIFYLIPAGTTIREWEIVG